MDKDMMQNKENKIHWLEICMSANKATNLNDNSLFNDFTIWIINHLRLNDPYS
jgi:hypothetical protein